MFSRRRSRSRRSNRSRFSSLNPFSRPVDRALEWKRRGRRLGMEALEDRRMLSGNMPSLLVAAIGDSYSSGEGNPSVPAWQNSGTALWLEGATPIETQLNALAHRSPDAASAQLVNMLSSIGYGVDFVFASASGATIDNSIRNRYAGVDDYEFGYDENNPLLEKQLVQVDEMAVDRPVDVLTMSFGGNDIGFGRIILSLLLADEDGFHQGDIDNNGITDHDDILRELKEAVDSGTGWEDVWDHINDPITNILTSGLPPWLQPLGNVITDPLVDWLTSFRVDSSDLAGLDGLPSEYAYLQGQIASLAHTPNNILITEYPAPFLDESGNPVEVGADILPSFEISASEVEWVIDNIVDPLNLRVRQAAQAHGWTYVGDYEQAFWGRQYGSPNGWFLTSTESETVMGG